MQIDNKLTKLPLAKYNPATLESLFGKTKILPIRNANREFWSTKNNCDSRIVRNSPKVNGNRYIPKLKYSNLCKRMEVYTSVAKSFNLCGIADSIAIIPNDDIRKSVAKIFKKYKVGITNAHTRVALDFQKVCSNTREMFRDLTEKSEIGISSAIRTLQKFRK